MFTSLQSSSGQTVARRLSTSLGQIAMMYYPLLDRPVAANHVICSHVDATPHTNLDSIIRQFPQSRVGSQLRARERNKIALPFSILENLKQFVHIYHASSLQLS